MAWQVVADITGPQGLSAYEVAVEQGFIGTHAEWLASLKGAKGDQGITGANGLDGQQGLPGPANVLTVVDTVTGPEPAGTTGGTSIYELRGIVMPNGVVTADPGTYYTDTAGTNGAWRWLKTSGTGSTGWEVVHGDTGWRALAVDTAVTGTSGLVHVRRVGPTVTLHVVSHASTAVGTAATLPTGFLCHDTSTQTLMTRPGVHGISSISLRISSADVATLGTANAVNAHAWITFNTKDAWPTTLPGTPA